MARSSTFNPFRAATAVTILCAVLGSARAHALRWTCDDAYISFRYAKNLADGVGLVFNAGERVEGYTNFLWTAFVTPAFPFGVTPERWTQFWGATAYAVTLLTLGALFVARTRAVRAPPRWFVPFACAAAACHRDWAVFAVSGLETAAFTGVAVGGFAVLAWPCDGRFPARAAAAGGLFGIAVLLRPDGVVLGAAAGAWLVARAFFAGKSRRSGAFAAVVFAVVLGAVLVAQTAFRVWYYGQLLPNTYYAKSAGIAWYGQGLTYLWLYLLRYPPIAVAPLAMTWLVARSRSSESERQLIKPASLAMVLGTAHAFWCVRVGGDFMFARFLVPSTPFFLVVIEAAFVAAADVHVLARGSIAAVSIAMIALLPSPIPPGALEAGIADERSFYLEEPVERLESQAKQMKSILDGLGARVAFYAGQARVVYRLDVPVAVESTTGLTDAFIASRPIEARSRIGHEKTAPASYLIDTRHVQLALSVRRRPQIEAYIPYVPVAVGGVTVRLLHWDPTFVRALRERGVVVPDYPSMLDESAQRLNGMTLEEVEQEYARARHFYFAFVTDPERERPFLARLADDRGPRQAR